MTVLEVPIPAAARAMELGRKHGAKTILNPAPARPLTEAIFASVDYLTPNESEARVCLGLEPDDPTPLEALAGRWLDLGSPHVVITLGANGVLWASAEGLRRIPALFSANCAAMFPSGNKNHAVFVTACKCSRSGTSSIQSAGLYRLSISGRKTL